MDFTNDIRGIINRFDAVTSNPESFISRKESFGDNVKQFLKQTYDFTKEQESERLSNALPELIVEEFDLEQIWQQIELQNNYCLDKCLSSVSKLAAVKHRLLFPDIANDQDLIDDVINKDDSNSEPNQHDENSHLKDNISNDTDSEDENESEDENSQIDLNSGDEDEQIIEVDKPVKKSIVDDEFFKLDEMNKFLNSEEKKISKTKQDTASDSESEGSIDFFQNKGQEDDNDHDFEGNDKINNPRYKDFFGTKTQQLMNQEKEAFKSDSVDSDDDDDNVVNDQKSSLELRENRLNAKISEIEAAAVSEKPWQLIGEVTAENRPQNSLLQEVLEFDLIRRPAPVITEETTHILEDVIRQRIKDKVYDDVVRKQKPVDTPLEFKKKLLLDQEKSKESLAQIYEKEFIQQREAVNVTEEKEEEEPKLHQEIKTLMYSLFRKLDALSNFHFTPKPAMAELKVVSNLPAINMEEVAPVASSEATLLAPEEIKSKRKANEIGKSERTRTDKKRERRKKKLKQREHANEKQKKEDAKPKTGAGSKYSKEKNKNLLGRLTKGKNVDKMDESLAKSVKSSTAFFSQLEDQVKSHINNKSKTKNKTNKLEINAKRIKL